MSGLVHAGGARPAARSLLMDGEPGQTYVHNMGGARDVLDPRTGAGRRATLRDQVQAARVMHNLVNQHQVTSLWQPQDVPDLLEPLFSYLILALRDRQGHRRPRHLASVPGAVPAGDGDGRHGRRRLSDTYPVDLAFSPVSPLILGGEVTDALVEQVRRGGVAVEILPCPAAATTAPGALVGAARAAERRGAGRRRAHAGRRAGHARLLRPPPERGGPAQRRRRLGHAGDGRGVHRRRALLARIRAGLRLLRAGQRQQGHRRAVRLRAHGQRRCSACRHGRGSCPASAPCRPAWRAVSRCSSSTTRSSTTPLYALSPRPWDADALDVDAMVDGVALGSRLPGHQAHQALHPQRVRHAAGRLPRRAGRLGRVRAHRRGRPGRGARPRTCMRARAGGPARRRAGRAVRR